MLGRDASFAQKASLGFAAFFIVNGIIGLIVNPDFGTGSDLSSKQFLIDWNGWHAVATLLLGATALVAMARPLWAVAFLAYNAIANGTVAVWALFDSTPLGLFDLPHVVTDFVLHLLVTVASVVAFVLQLSRDRRAKSATVAN